MPKGEGYLRKRGSVWYFEFMYKGQRYYERIGNVSKTIAREIASDIRAKIIRGEYIPSREVHTTFSELADAYYEWYTTNSKAGERAKKEQKRKIDILKNFFGHMPVHRISTFTIEQYKRYRLETSKAKPVSIDKELVVLRAIFKKAKELELYTGDIPQIPFFKAKSREVVRFLTPQEARKLLEVSPEHLRRIILFALNTGCRAGEILSLKWGQVDFKGGVIHVEAAHTKSKRKHTIIMNSEVKALLERIREEQREKGIDHGYVFTNSLGLPYGYQGYKRAFKTALKKAGIENFRFHDLRHTFASWIALQTKDIYLVQKLLNHQSVETTKRYAHLTQEYVQNSLEQITALLRQESEDSIQSA
ncbi:MAG: site-specific integrase [Aquificaceae bacterium]|nr:site-specific integrase [Aquificaceae bacterium]